MLNRYCKGFSLIELMIGFVIGAFVIASSLTAFVAIMRSNADILKQARLEYELSKSLNLMANDIRRAGYWGNAANDLGTSTNTNPFMAAANRLQVAGNCILFSYDLDADGNFPALNTAPSDERFGYRLTGQRIQTRPESYSTFACDDADNTWYDITNQNEIQITNLTFTPVVETVDIDGDGSGTSTIAVTRVDISLTGQLADDATINRTYTKSVRVRNDLYTP